MPASPSPRRPAKLTDSDIRDPERAMARHLSDLDARMDAQTIRVNGAAIEAHACVEKLTQGSSTRFSLRAFRGPREPCGEVGAKNGHVLEPCLHDPRCSRYEKARKAFHGGPAS